MVGKTILQYKILEKLGKGGMGDVYLAEDIKLGRKVALKFLQEHRTSDSEARMRFQREAHAVAALNHPNIVTIHDINEHEGQVYIVMEYIEGRALKNIILDSGKQTKTTPDDRTGEKTEILPGSLNKRKGYPLPYDKIVNIGLQLAKGLATAHDANIVHRDIKPQNIIVQPNGRVKILDFGLAKLRGLSQLTSELTTVGTLHYMSPEQFSGDPVDSRTDIWSLGIVIFEMITGHQPFAGESQQTVMFSIMNRDLPDLRTVDPKIPKDLVKIVKQCLEKNPMKRYQHIHAMVVDLQTLQESGSVKRLSRSSSSGMKTSKSLPFKPKLVIPAILMIVLLLVIFFTPSRHNPLIKWLGVNQMPDKKYIVVLPIENKNPKSSDQSLCDGFQKIIIEKLTQIEPFLNDFWVVPLQAGVDYKLTTPLAALKQYSSTLAIKGELSYKDRDVVLSFDLWDTKTNKVIKSTSFNGQIGNLSLFQEGLVEDICKMLEIVLPEPAAGILERGKTALPGAFEFYVRGQGYLKESGNLKNINQAILYFQKAIDQDPSFTWALIGAGESYCYKFIKTNDNQWAEKSIQYCNKALIQNGNNYQAYCLLGRVFKKMGRSDEAILQFNQSIRFNPSYFSTYAELTGIYNTINRPGKAEEVLKKAIIAKPDYWPVYNHLGYFYLNKARWSEAVNMYKKVIELTPQNAEGYRNLGVVYYLQEDFDMAAEMLKKSTDIQPEYFSLINLGTIYYFRGRFTDSILYNKAALRFNKEDYAVWGNLGDAYRHLPDSAENSLIAYNKAIAKINILLKQNPDDPLLRSSLALYMARSGNLSGALKQVEQVVKLNKSNLDVWLNIVYVYELAGQRHLALDSLKPYLDRHGSFEYIKNEPDLKELREDQRFKEMAAGKWFDNK